MKSTIISVYCPCCEELIPVKIDLVGSGVDKEFIVMGGHEVVDDAPYPLANLIIELDLDRLKDGGLYQLIERRDAEKRIT